MSVMRIVRWLTVVSCVGWRAAEGFVCARTRVFSATIATRAIPREAEAAPPVGAVLRGTIASMVAYGAFVALEGFRDGLAHTSELSRDNGGEADFRVGQPVFVKVLRVDAKGVALSLRAVDQRSGKVFAVAPTRAAAPPPRSKIAAPRLASEDLTMRFVRASGAGGQNVNKVSTKCELRFDVTTLAAPLAAALRATHGGRISAAGVLVVQADEHRSQRQNAAAARERLQAILDAAALTARGPARADPKRAERKRKLARGADRRRLDDKKMLKSKKANRRSAVHE